MKIYFNETCLFSRRYDKWEQLNNEYRQTEAEHGRTVPQYAWETFALIIAGWLIKKATDELWKLTVERIKSRDEQKNPPTAVLKEEKRHQELMEKLDRIAEAIEKRGGGQPEMSTVMDIVEAARVSASAVSVEFETDAEQDLEASLKQALGTLPPNMVTIRKSKA